MYNVLIFIFRMCFFLFSERLVKINFQKKIYFKAEINLCELIFKYFGNFDVAMIDSIKCIVNTWWLSKNDRHVYIGL
jgi:hypothetical protein